MYSYYNFLLFHVHRKLRTIIKMIISSDFLIVILSAIRIGNIYLKKKFLFEDLLQIFYRIERFYIFIKKVFIG